MSVVVVSVLAPAGNPAALVADAGVVRGQAREATSNASGVVTFDLLPLEQLYMLVMKGYPADNAPIWFRMPPHDATLGEAVRATPITGGGGTTEPLLFGTSTDDVPDPAELDIVGTTVSGTIPAYTGGLHWLIARAGERAVHYVGHRARRPDRAEPDWGVHALPGHGDSGRQDGGLQRVGEQPG